MWVFLILGFSGVGFCWCFVILRLFVAVRTVVVFGWFLLYLLGCVFEFGWVFSLGLFQFSVVWFIVCFGSLVLVGLILLFNVCCWGCLILYGGSCCSFVFVGYWQLIVLLYFLILLCVFVRYLCLVCVMYSVVGWVVDLIYCV